MDVLHERAVPACFHCGLPVTVPGAHQALILGALRELCCLGCETVASTIVAAGFERYYETRDMPAAEPPSSPAVQDLLPAEVHDDPLAQHEFVAVSSEHEREACLILDRIRCAALTWLRRRPTRAPGSVSATCRKIAA